MSVRGACKNREYKDISYVKALHYTDVHQGGRPWGSRHESLPRRRPRPPFPNPRDFARGVLGARAAVGLWGRRRGERSHGRRAATCVRYMLKAQVLKRQCPSIFSIWSHGRGYV